MGAECIGHCCVDSSFAESTTFQLDHVCSVLEMALSVSMTCGTLKDNQKILVVSSSSLLHTLLISTVCTNQLRIISCSNFGSHHYLEMDIYMLTTFFEKIVNDDNFKHFI